MVVFIDGLHYLNSTCSPSINTTIISKGNSVASHHYFRTKEAHILQNVQNTIGPTVQQPDHSILQSQESVQVLLIKKFSIATQHVLILPNLNSASLLSLRQICDDGYTVVLTKKTKRCLKNEGILQGVQNWQDDLWYIPIKQPNITTHNYKTPTSHTGPYTNLVANITIK